MSEFNNKRLGFVDIILFVLYALVGAFGAALVKGLFGI